MTITERPEITSEYLASQGLSVTFPERFWKRVFITPTHWLWEGERRMPMGHGRLWRGVRHPTTNKWQWLIFAHVASWILTRGPIPKGGLVLHKCPGRHIPWCVNPDHLYIGNERDNSQDSIKNKTHWFSNNPKAFAGNDNPRRKVSQNQVDEMRERYILGGVSQNQLAREYGITQAAIWLILHRHNWK